MERLLIVRHGIAVPHGSPEYADDDRPLTPKGERRARQVGRGIARLDLGIERIVTSPLPRARRTAEILAEALVLGAFLECSDALRVDHGTESIREWLRGRTEARLMIVGHNPWCSELVSLLATGKTGGLGYEMGKAGAALLEMEEHLGWRLRWAATAGLLRAVGGAG